MDDLDKKIAELNQKIAKDELATALTRTQTEINKK